MLSEFIGQVEVFYVDLCGLRLTGHVLVYEQLEVSLGADERCLLLHFLGLSRDFASQRGHVLRQLLQVVLHEIDAGFLQLLQLLELRRVLGVDDSREVVHGLDGLLVGLRRNLSFVLHCDALLTNSLHFIYCHLAFLVGLHGLFYYVLLLLGLLLEHEELVSRFLLLELLGLVLCPDGRPLLYTVSAVIGVVLLVDFKWLHEIPHDILH